ncbi:MAG: DUF1461 domain-containing protein [Candidatus Ventricola sp.]
MNKMAWITGILTGLMVLLAALGALGTAVESIAGDEALYGAQSRQAVMRANGFASEEEVSAYIGLDAAQQQAAAGELAAYVTGGADALPEMLNENERQHMRDVRALIAQVSGMSRAALTAAAALAVVTAWTGAKLKRRRLPRLIGGLAAVGLLALAALTAAGALASGGFAQMFTAMHGLLFDNDLWLMNPQTDVLIRMMPQTLFEQALLDVANRALRMLLIVWVTLLVLHAIVQSMIRRHLTEGEDA